HERSLRWSAPFRHGSMIVPLIAGCLVLAMVAGMVLTMFSANPYFAGLTSQRGGDIRGGHASASTGKSKASLAAPSATKNPSGAPSASAAPRLPDDTITVAGTRQLQLTGVTGAALALVPIGCGCASTIRRLVTQAKSDGIIVYLVAAKRGDLSDLSKLAPAATRGTAELAIDSHSALHSAYSPHGLTVLLVDAHGHVEIARNLSAGFHLQTALHSLQPTP